MSHCEWDIWSNLPEDTLHRFKKRLRWHRWNKCNNGGETPYWLKVVTWILRVESILSHRLDPTWADPVNAMTKDSASPALRNLIMLYHLDVNKNKKSLVEHQPDALLCWADSSITISSRLPSCSSVELVSWRNVYALLDAFHVPCVVLQ